MDAWFFWKSLSIGMAVAAPVGPMSLLCIHRTLDHGQGAGLVFGAGVAAADLTYAAIAAFGVTALASLLLAGTFWVKFVGSLLLVVLGVRIALAPPRTDKPGEVRRLGQAGISDGLRPDPDQPADDPVLRRYIRFRGVGRLGLAVVHVRCRRLCRIDAVVGDPHDAGIEVRGPVPATRPALDQSHFRRRPHRICRLRIRHTGVKYFRFSAGHSRNLWCACVLFFAALGSVRAQGDDTAQEFPPRVWISPGIYSLHFDRSKDLRNDNWGPGVEVAVAPDHTLIGGNYINSNGARTYYGAYEWRPLHWQFENLELVAGVLVGAFDGYPNYHDGGWFVAALPVLAIEGRYLGVNLSVIPTIRDRLDGALAIQFKLRVW